MMNTNATTLSVPVYFRISELATAPETTARIYTDPKGQVRNIKAKPAHKGITPLGKSTILKWCKEGRFPAPIRRFQGMTLWNAAEVYQWLADLNTAANDGVA